jgi:hypothetical protein
MLQNVFRCVCCGRLILLSESLPDGSVFENLGTGSARHGDAVIDDARRVCIRPCARRAFHVDVEVSTRSNRARGKK